MLDSAFAADFESLLAVERVRLNDQIRREIGTTTSTLSGKGILQGSAAMKALTDVGARAVPIFAQAALNLLARSANAHGLVIGGSNRDEIEGFLSGHIRSEVDELQAIVADTPSFKWKGATSAPFLAELDRQAKIETDRIGGELRLIAAANDKRAAESTSGTPTLVFNAPVGVVQTGPGSFGVANQSIDSAAREALQSAFASLLDRLANEQSSDLPLDRDEVIELANEGKTELAKEKPNLTKLKGIVSAVGGAISYAPKLREAYEVLKWAGGLVGVTLPG